MEESKNEYIKDESDSNSSSDSKETVKREFYNRYS